MCKLHLLRRDKGTYLCVHCTSRKTFPLQALQVPLKRSSGVLLPPWDASTVDSTCPSFSVWKDRPFWPTYECCPARWPQSIWGSVEWHAVLILWFYLLAGSFKEKKKSAKKIWSSRTWHPPVWENVGSVGPAIGTAVPTLSGSNWHTTTVIKPDEDGDRWLRLTGTYYVSGYILSTSRVQSHLIILSV